MATITGVSNEKVYNIPKWLGLNEHPDGDTRLKLGEASKMVNWKITRDGNLKRRPGTQLVMGLRKNYSVSMANGVTELFTCLPIDELTVYAKVSAEAVPGKITPYNYGIVFGGVLHMDGSVEDGVLTADGEHFSFPETSGALALESNTVKMTPVALLEYLNGDESPAYVYIEWREQVYAVDAQNIVLSDGEYAISGYLVSAIPGNSAHPAVTGLWAGMYNGKHVLLAACDDTIYNIYDETNGKFQRRGIGSDIDTGNGVHFFSFDNGVYMLNGKEYYFWNNAVAMYPVEGYRPLVAIAISPLVVVDGELSDGAESGITTAEYVNRLTGTRRVWISPDGKGDTFQLPERGIASVDWVKDLRTNENIPPAYYSVDREKGRVTFTAAFIAQVGDVTNSHEIAYSVTANFRHQVTGMRFSEYYSGSTDTRLFFYGDGTNKAIYSGMDYNGMPRADYFPDQYEAKFGDTNTPITSMVRHYGDLVCYKEDSCWSARYNLITLETGDVVPGLYVLPVNKDKGNLAPGQVRLVDNNPVTCSGTELYHWINSSYYDSSLSRDERQAKRISDRIQKSIRDLDLSKACMWDDNDNQEFYIAQNGIMLVWNYATDTWYRYEGIDATCMCSFLGDLYIGTADGKILRLTYDVSGDEGRAIESHWESGAMDFGSDYSRKYSSMMWVGLKPETGTSVNICVKTDRKDTFKEKVVASEKAKIANESFMVRTKIKAKKFVYYRLILETEDYQPAVTVNTVDFRVRMTGYTK